MIKSNLIIRVIQFYISLFFGHYTSIGENFVKYENTIKIEMKIKQELQEVLKFPTEIFWNLEASLKSELLYF